MVWVALKLMGQSQMAIREGSAVDGVKGVEEVERTNHDFMCHALYAKSDNRSRISG